MQSILWAAGGTGFTFFMTAMGASAVFFFRKQASDSVQRVFLGFAAGVMMAASVWSLLIPAAEAVEAMGGIEWIPPVGGFLVGVIFLQVMDRLLPHLHPDLLKGGSENAAWKRMILLVLAVTLHNIPEGMAVGLSFALAGQDAGDLGTLSAAVALALGIGIQNVPEGAAVALPLRQEGMSRWKAFFWGSLSGLVELVFGVLVVLIAGGVRPLMPWMLSFAAGTMMYVLVEELIPAAHLEEDSNMGTLGVMAGFVIMMVLDIALG